MEMADETEATDKGSQQVLRHCTELQPLIYPHTGLVSLINFLPTAIDDLQPQIWSQSTYLQPTSHDEEATITTSSH